MVYEIVWTAKALDSYVGNIQYLQQAWTQKEISTFIQIVEKKLEIISSHPYLGSPRNKKSHNIRFTILNKSVSLIYSVKTRKKQIELLLFWNTRQHPGKLKT
jgi:plasmid stabilization system protein ParE